MKIKEPIGIKSIGKYVPSQKLRLITGDNGEVIIHEASKEETTYKMGSIALTNALAEGGINKSDLKHWLHCNDGPGDYLFQLVGRKILDEVEIGSCHTYNLYQSSNCSLLAIKLLIDHLRSDSTALIGGVSTSNSWKNHTYDRRVGDAVFGDGSAVLLLEKGNDSYTFDFFTMKTIGKYHDVAAFQAGGFLEEISQKTVKEDSFKYNIINERSYEELKKISVDIGIQTIEKTLEKAKLSRNDIDLLVLHSPTPKISSSFIKELALNSSSFIETVNDFGYMCSSGILLSLYEAVYNYQLKKGSKILVTSLGIDGNWCSAIITV
ncbi:3-oxoacyl-ACP synthase III family protein [Priestia koreensis]|uniref:3-oxoacyl-ACP synthase III family protein n=1 Tax=Priestia koreensis TaxID=284581 RepID=UPI001F59D53B|nr:3-oxoacyl-[acyl-carrier-protein] synthase III C-terminal domain-containing protein [Priestia koreensis]UNL86790.1 hypothetical protein IE339_09990 [Priestia koreensis]